MILANIAVALEQSQNKKGLGALYFVLFIAVLYWASGKE